jgi:hypothetical protein
MLVLKRGLRAALIAMISVCASLLIYALFSRSVTSHIPLWILGFAGFSFLMHKIGHSVMARFCIGIICVVVTAPFLDGSKSAFFSQDLRTAGFLLLFFIAAFHFLSDMKMIFPAKTPLVFIAVVCALLLGSQLQMFPLMQKVYSTSLLDEVSMLLPILFLSLSFLMGYSVEPNLKFFLICLISIVIGLGVKAVGV